MQSFNLLVSICLLYVAALFVIAYVAERGVQEGRLNFLRSPVIYTLSLSVYCTAWTFYGAVGSAARSGLEFVAIYLGPTLVFVGWWWFLRKLVRIGRTQRITSIADLLSSRYGKSNTLAVVVTLLAVIGTTPYIALQLQSLTLSFFVFTGGSGEGTSTPFASVTAFWVAAGLAVFTIVFGTRSLDANERHHGVVTAIAVEAVVKLIALLSVGIFVVWGVASGPADIFERMDQDLLQSSQIFNGRWVTLMFLSAAAIICLPRMFQVVVVENSNERHLATASWAFPLYLFLMSLFVLPIAIAGQSELPADANPDLFVMTVPLAKGQGTLATLAFLGGFSSATSMVIVAAIALSTMMSNHIVLPIWLQLNKKRSPASDDVRTLLLRTRRISIGVVLALGYFYFQITGGSDALASIGLIAFLGVAQVLPALLGGVFWHSATRPAAIMGICTGFFFWAYTLFLPSFDGAFILSQSVIENGPFGISALRPQSLWGNSFEDPLVHAVFWSISFNTLVFVVASLLTNPNSMERQQSAQFINVYGRISPSSTIARNAEAEELLILAQRILGRQEAMNLFNQTAVSQGKVSGLPDPTQPFVEELERKFAGSVGAATSHAMLAQITGGESVSVEDMIAVADETAQIMEYSERLKTQSEELKKTAQQLRAANSQLLKLGEQKDTFLSQVSHELRTPMTSIRSFSGILRDSDSLPPEKLKHFSSVIHTESIRLTRLLDDILDLSFMENGKVQLNIAPVNLSEVINRAATATETQLQERSSELLRNPASEQIKVATDSDRLAQVVINLVANANKYCDAEPPQISVSCRRNGGTVEIDVADNGSGVDESEVELIFQKFSKLSGGFFVGSAGLGLPISREIMRNLGGTLTYEPGGAGALFRVTLPLEHTEPASA
ncbi:MAG: sodium:solute symporter [Rhodobacteraceae bacterium]|nr:sodium:solute symporter [Paracoccaceae bacterium]